MGHMRTAGILCLTFFALLTLGFGMADVLLKPRSAIALTQLLLVFGIGLVMLAASIGLWVQKTIQTKLRQGKNQTSNPFIPKSKYAVWTRQNNRRVGKPIPRTDPLAPKSRRYKAKPHTDGQI